MNEYLVTVSSGVMKQYMIKANSNEEAISSALDFFVADKKDDNKNDNVLSNVSININSIAS